MNQNKLTILINKPLSVVFAFCVTPPNAKFWVPRVVNEKTNEWPIKIGTIYTEYKDDNTSFNLIISNFKENEYCEWKNEEGKYFCRYTFTKIDDKNTELEYHEWGNIDGPFTQDVLEKLKKVLETS